MTIAAKLTLPLLLIQKNIGRPMSAAKLKQTSWRFVRLKRILDLTRVRSRGTGI